MDNAVTAGMVGSLAATAVSMITAIVSKSTTLRTATLAAEAQFMQRQSDEIAKHIAALSDCEEAVRARDGDLAAFMRTVAQVEGLIEILVDIERDLTTNKTDPHSALERLSFAVERMKEVTAGQRTADRDNTAKNIKGDIERGREK